MAKLNTSKLSNEDIEDLFSEAFEDQVAKHNSISEFEVTCIRDSANAKSLDIEVMIVGMAGSPTLDQFKNGEVENSQEVIGSRGGDKIKFKLLPKKTVVLNSNDYNISYAAI